MRCVAHCGWECSTVQCVEVCGTLHCGNVGGSVFVAHRGTFWVEVSNCGTLGASGDAFSTGQRKDCGKNVNRRIAAKTCKLNLCNNQPTSIYSLVFSFNNTLASQAGKLSMCR